MPRTVAIGEQDFSEIIRNGYFYIDKTDFIQEWWENGDSVTLITRPRRFGKTITMSMLYHFFSVNKKSGGGLFQNLKIWKEEKYQKLQGTYPVIFLSFAGIKGRSYQDAYYDIYKVVVREYRKHVSILESGCFLPSDREQYFRIMNGKANESDLRASLNQLSEYLYQYYGKKALVFLDEYDTPMHEAFIKGYWEELTDFMRGFLNASFKTNPYLGRGIMTGITRVSKESIFSDLNNLSVVTAASRLYETVFGFTEDEVQEALQEFCLQNESDKVRHWYDGFRFGNCDHIYNPWSVTNYLKFREFGTYWANTSSNQLVSKLIQKGSPNIKMIMEDLLKGQHFCTSLDEQIAFEQLSYSESAVWSLLLAGGYLKIAGFSGRDSEDYENGIEDISYELALTNQEIVFLFKKLIRGWFHTGDVAYNGFIKALLADDVKAMNAYMRKIVSTMLSYFDSGNKPSEKTEPERFYHGLVLGMIADLSKKYIVTSNRESGLGRYDVMLEPRSPEDDGIIFEFKVFDGQEETGLNDTVNAAVRQILDKKYAAMLEEKLADKNHIRVYGFAFRGKEVRIDGGYIKNLRLPGELENRVR